jgi:hypothetical protein
LIKREDLKFRPESKLPWSLHIRKEEGGEAILEVEILDADGNNVYGHDGSGCGWIVPDDLEAVVFAVNAMRLFTEQPMPTDQQPILTKSIFKAEVLHEPEHDERVGQMDFPDVVANCIDGDFSGDFSLEKQVHYYNRKDADEAVQEQASDPGFFFGSDEEE